METICQTGLVGAEMDLQSLKSEVSWAVDDIRDCYENYKHHVLLNGRKAPLTQIPVELETAVKNAITGFLDISLDDAWTLTYISLNDGQFFNDYMMRRRILRRASHQIHDNVMATEKSGTSTFPTVPDIPAHGILSVPDVSEDVVEDGSVTPQLRENGGWVYFNVGGEILSATKYTLETNYPNNLFALMARIENFKSGAIPKIENGAIMLDMYSADVENVRQILNFLRTSTYSCPTHRLKALADEAAKFMVDELCDEINKRINECV